MTDLVAIVGAVVASTSVLAFILIWMNNTINKRFDDAQATMNQRFDDAQRANDQAHASISENIKGVERRVDNLERQLDSGLNRLQSQVSAITPRAAAEETR